MGFSGEILGWDSQVEFWGGILRWDLMQVRTLRGDYELEFSGGIYPQVVFSGGMVVWDS